MSNCSFCHGFDGHHRPYCPVKQYQPGGAVCQKIPFTAQKVDTAAIYKRLDELEARIKALEETQPHD